ncbi:MAG TPA: polysaccharide biosynthesis/export family protein [Steroidobacteraceae bacterium]|nr:polysaccharide biosynthesis/export family protein [Steroidobacteraceae bacterium]
MDVDDAITRRLLALRTQRLFSETLQTSPALSRVVGPGDVLEVTIWEASPPTLFGASALQPAEIGTAVGTPVDTGTIPTSQATTLPDQMIDDQGYIMVPFAGRVLAAGKTLEEIEADIVKRLTGKANQPQVLVRRTQNLSSNATIVGEVTTSRRVPLLPGSGRLLDAIADAGGVKDPVSKTTIQVTRGGRVYSLPLETIIEDPRQNVTLMPGDVITALFQPYSFMALGASGKTDEINFETQGISLAQALARSGGLIDQRSNAKGAFIFRFEPKDALDWPRQPVKTTPDGLVPVVYRFDLTDPSSFFVMQSFPIENRDVLYVANAPADELQKFLNLIFTVAYPILTAKQTGAF